MLEIEKEKFLTLAQASKRVPSTPHISTLSRWIERGVRGQKLTATVLGGRRYVTERALEEFFAALNQPRSVEQLAVSGVAAIAKGEPRTSCTSQQREVAIRRAEEGLAEEGINK